MQRGAISPRYMLLGALFLVGVSFLHYGHFNLATDYSHYAWARALQGLGYAFFFVPLTMIAYSQLKPDQNNKASSLTNFFRNWGGSFGIAFINTMSDRRLEFHQSTVGSNLSSSSAAIQQQIKDTANYMMVHGASPANALQASYAYVYSRLQAQAHFLAFMDCFQIIGVLTLLAAPLVLATKPFQVGSKKAEAVH